MSNATRIKEEEEEPELQQVVETKEEPEPEPTKEEHMELWVFQEEGQMLVMHKTNTSVVTASHEEMLCNVPGQPQVMETKEEPEPVLIKEEPVDQLDLHIKMDTDSITVTSTDEQNNSSDPDLNKDQLLPANRPEPENQHQQGSNQEDSGGGDPSLRPDKRRQETRSNKVDVNSSELKRQETETAFCEICGKVFRTCQRLTDDIKVHSAEKLHPCEVCGKAFRHRAHSNKNKRICTSETPKTYKLLGKTSRDQAGKVENTQEKLLHPCDMCGKAFKACDSYLKPHHIQRRRGEKRFSSQTGGKRFTWNSSALHTRSHTGEKPLPCEVCGKHFK